MSRIAIIGGGIAGLSAAYYLGDDHEVTLFEKDAAPGGNAHTIDTRDGLSFDIAVAVFGRFSYPRFSRLLDELGVARSPLRGNGAGWRDLDTGEASYFTWTARGLLAQRLSLLHPFRAYAFARSFANMNEGIRLFRAGRLQGLTMREAFELLPPFPADSLLLHMFVMCLVSSMYYEEIMDAPAEFFFGKIATHWDFFRFPVFTLYHSRDNTRAYVKALAARMGDRLALGSRVTSVSRTENGVAVALEGGGEHSFDKVLFACNADQALSMLERPTDDEKRLLGAWRYKDGPIVVHRDRSLFPGEFQNLFTFLYTKKEGSINTSVNGHIRNLKSVPRDCAYVSSQHPNFPIDPDRIEYRRVFRTPIFDRASVASIPELSRLNGVMNTYYCGSHFGHGLHEDAVESAFQAARAIGSAK